MEPIHTEELEGYTLEIFQDYDADNPLEDEDFVNIAFFHRAYDYRCGIGKDFSLTDPQSYWDWLEENPVIAVPLYLYDHGLLRFRAGSFQGLLPQGHAEFDSGQVGEVFITCKEARRIYGWQRITAKRRAEIEQILRSTVETLDQYASGDVYGYRITDPHGDIADSCWGFFGWQYAEEEITREFHDHVRYELRRTQPVAVASLIEAGAGL